MPGNESEQLQCTHFSLQLDKFMKGRNSIVFSKSKCSEIRLSKFLAECGFYLLEGNKFTLFWQREEEQKRREQSVLLVFGVIVPVICWAWLIEFSKGPGVPTFLTREGLSCGEGRTGVPFLCMLFSLSNLSYPIGGTPRPSFVDISPCCWSIISRREGISFAVAPITIGGTLSIKLDVPKEVEKYFIIKKWWILLLGLVLMLFMINNVRPFTCYNWLHKAIPFWWILTTL